MDNWWSDLPDTVPRWLETLKSLNGLYRMSASAYHEESLDATTLALDLMSMMGIVLPRFEADGVYAYINDCRDPVNGLYQEMFCEWERYGSDRLWEMSATYFGFQVAGIMFGLSWGLPDPFSFYHRFLQPGAISRYMTEAMPWDTKPMGAGNMVDAAATMMRMNVAMGYYEYWHVIGEMYAWLDEHQHPRHGFWGDLDAQGLDGVVQAGYHILRGMHFQDGRRIKYGQAMLDLVAKCMKEPSAPLDACHYMDCAVLAEHLSAQVLLRYPGLVTAQQIIDGIAIMRRDDGGFSFSAEGAIKNHNRYEVTPGEMESDLVGTVFYLQALRSALRVLGEEVPWGESATHGVRR